jgi:hypothetical protein
MFFHPILQSEQKNGYRRQRLDRCRRQQAIAGEFLIDQARKGRFIPSDDDARNGPLGAAVSHFDAIVARVPPCGCLCRRRKDNVERARPKPAAHCRPCMQEDDPADASSDQCQRRYLAQTRMRKPCLQFLNRNLTDKSLQLGRKLPGEPSQNDQDPGDCAHGNSLDGATISCRAESPKSISKMDWRASPRRATAVAACGRKSAGDHAVGPVLQSRRAPSFFDAAGVSQVSAAFVAEDCNVRVDGADAPPPSQNSASDHCLCTAQVGGGVQPKGAAMLPE